MSHGVLLTPLPAPAGEAGAAGRPGVRVITERMPSVRSVAVGFWVGCGSRDEQPEVAGASHFLEHLLFKGTPRRSARQIAEELDAVGGDMNAFTTKEFTCFYARCLDRDLPLAIDVLADMITSSTMAEEDVASERDVVLEEIRMHHDTPDDLVHSVFSDGLFAGHPLAREVLGDEETITRMPRDHIHGYYRDRYTPEEIVVAAAGNLDHEQVVTLVAEALDGWEPEPAPEPRNLRAGAATGPRVLLRSRPTEQAHLVLGGPGLARGDERRFTVSVMNQALGGGMASRLFQEVRERRGLVYSVYSYHTMHAETGSYAIYAGTSPGKVEQVLQVVRDELAGIVADGLDEAELIRAKGSLAGSMALSLEDTGSRMSRIGRALTTSTPLLSLDEVVQAIERVTLDQVRTLAGELFTPAATLAVVGPLDDSSADALSAYTAALAA
ncbi:MAG: M16 family metallopeptidase [Egibacteraceae bacterium]